MKLKTLTVTLLSFITINLYAQDFSYKYKLFSKPFIVNFEIGTAYIESKQDHILGSIVIPKENINLNLGYNQRLNIYTENNESIILLPETQSVLTAFQECLSHLRSNSLESRMFKITTGYDKYHKKILVLKYQDINNGRLKFKVEDITGNIGIENIKYLLLYYTPNNKGHIEEIKAIRKGHDITAKLESK